MGGGYYDRDIEVAPTVASNSVNATTTNHSIKSDSLFDQNRTLNPSLNPKNRNLVISNQQQTSPIVIAVDVTGSMGVFAKCIWDKLPLFYGQLRSKNYIPDPIISFAGIGDSYTDKAPLQVTEFQRGSALDDAIAKLWLEGGGGGQNYESYELCAYFYDRHFTPDNQNKGFFFFMGDEGFYGKIKSQHIHDVIGDNVLSDLDSLQVFNSLRSKFHVFFIHKPYWDKTIDAKQLAKWKVAVGEDRVLEIVEPKAVVDIMLGAIALTGGNITLREYLEDLEDRGQSQERIADVSRALATVIPQNAQPEVTTSSSQPPPKFMCPITQEIMTDPVLCSDGNSYERGAIEFWISSNNESPITGQPFPSKELVPNHALQQEIQAWKAKNQ